VAIRICTCEQAPAHSMIFEIFKLFPTTTSNSARINKLNSTWALSIYEILLHAHLQLPISAKQSHKMNAEHVSLGYAVAASRASSSCTNSPVALNQTPTMHSMFPPVNYVYQHDRTRGRRLAFKDAQDAHNWLDAIKVRPHIDPTTDFTIDLVDANRQAWVVAMIDAVYDLDHCKDGSKMKAHFIPTGRSYFEVFEVEAACHILVDVLIEHCRNGFRSLQKFNHLINNKSSVADDKTVNCEDRGANVLIALRTWKSICKGMIEEAGKKWQLVNAPLSTMARKVIEANGNTKKKSAATAGKNARKELKAIKQSVPAPTVSYGLEVAQAELPTASSPTGQGPQPSQKYPSPQQSATSSKPESLQFSPRKIPLCKGESLMQPHNEISGYTSFFTTGISYKEPSAADAFFLNDTGLYARIFSSFAPGTDTDDLNSHDMSLDGSSAAQLSSDPFSVPNAYEPRLPSQDTPPHTISQSEYTPNMSLTRPILIPHSPSRRVKSRTRNNQRNPNMSDFGNNSNFRNYDHTNTNHFDHCKYYFNQEGFAVPVTLSAASAHASPVMHNAQPRNDAHLNNVRDASFAPTTQEVRTTTTHLPQPMVHGSYPHISSKRTREEANNTTPLRSSRRMKLDSNGSCYYDDVMPSSRSEDEFGQNNVCSTDEVSGDHGMMENPGECNGKNSATRTAEK
jgi:hypothetical protein